MKLHIYLSGKEEELVEKICTFFPMSKNELVKKCLIERCKQLFEEAGGDCF